MLTVEMLLRSVEEWNKARQANPDLKVDLRGANLSGANLNMAFLTGVILINSDLHDANLTNANLTNANLTNADLSEAILYDADLSFANLLGVNLNSTNLHRAELRGAVLRGATLNRSDLSNANLHLAYLTEADLKEAILTNAFLEGTDLKNANLTDAELYGAILTHAVLTDATLNRADLRGANLRGANLRGADLNETIISHTIFGDIDLSTVKNLDKVRHDGPSTIGIDTLSKSKGNIPEVFLKGCGLHDTFIEYAHSLTSKAIEFYSCFISYSTADKAFADRLYADLQAKGVRCWYAPHDMKGGKKIHDQIGEAIRQHEKLLLILSENSINSDWVKQEIAKAKKREDTEGKRVLFPIGLIEFGKIEEWEFPDSKGRDLAEEIRLYYIPSFIGWEKDNEVYTTEFGKLLNSFLAERSTEGKV